MIIPFMGKLKHKRFYLPGVKFTINCEHCGVRIPVDLGGEDYLIDPVVGEEREHFAYCGECYEETSYRMTLNLGVHIGR